MSEKQFFGPPLTFTNPPNGANPVDFSATGGSITLQGNIDLAHPPSSMAYYVDGRTPQSITVPAANPWTAPLSGADCLPTNAWHCVTVLAWDRTGCTMITNSFYRSN